MIGSLHRPFAAGNAQIGSRLHAVVLHIEGKRSPVDGHEATGGVLIVARLHPVAPGRHRERAVGDLHAVLAAQAVLLGRHGQRAAGNDQIVLGEQGRVRLVLAIGKRIGRAVGQCALRALGQGDEHLVGLLHLEGSAVGVANRRPRQHHLHLVLVGCVHHKSAVGKLARHHIGTGGRNSHRGAVRRGAIALNGRTRARKHDLRCRGGIVGSVLVAIGIVEVHPGDIDERIPIDRLGIGCRAALASRAAVFGGIVVVGAARAAGQRQRSRQRRSQSPARPPSPPLNRAVHHIRLHHPNPPSNVLHFHFLRETLEAVPRRSDRGRLSTLGECGP